MQTAISLPMALPVPISASSIEAYIQAVQRMPMLTAEDERALAAALARAERPGSRARAGACRTCAWWCRSARGYLGYGCRMPT
jgi:RNA polymerase sigma-32 factor